MKLDLLGTGAVIIEFFSILATIKSYGSDSMILTFRVPLIVYSPEKFRNEKKWEVLAK